MPFFLLLDLVQVELIHVTVLYVCLISIFVPDEVAHYICGKGPCLALRFEALACMPACFSISCLLFLSFSSLFFYYFFSFFPPIKSTTTESILRRYQENPVQITSTPVSLMWVNAAFFTTRGLALIYIYAWKITKLPWQPSVRLSAKMATKF